MRLQVIFLFNNASFQCCAQFTVYRQKYIFVLQIALPDTFLRNLGAIYNPYRLSDLPQVWPDVSFIINISRNTR